MWLCIDRLNSFKELFGNSVQLPSGVVDAFTEKTEANTSVDPAGSLN
jgi:hypothetical protein